MYVYEFLYRGRQNGETAWHVILADTIPGLGGELKHAETLPLTPAQAETKGFPLSVVIAEINAEALKARDKALVDKAAAEAERDKATAERDAAIRERDQRPSKP